MSVLASLFRERLGVLRLVREIRSQSARDLGLSFAVYVHADS